MGTIQMPTRYFGKPIDSVSKLLEEITAWHKATGIAGADVHRRVWYRGHEDSAYELRPGVYRDRFTTSATAMYRKDTEDARLELEREMLSEFRTSGATLLDPNAIVEVYFLAQHYGMPTRLLDWTTNPLAALFFAVCNATKLGDGDLLVMDAPKITPPMPRTSGNIVTMRHPYVTDAIGQSFWHTPKEKREPRVLPMRPDNHAGRIAQQSSCFTLHMHLAAACQNPTLARIRIQGTSKGKILEELRKLNINEFSIYNDLDHLSKEIKRTRGLM